MAISLSWCTALLACGIACAQQQSFDWNQRWENYVHRTYSWQRLSLLAVDTGIDHLMREPREWGCHPHTFAFRYASGVGKRVVRNTIELGVGQALGEDIRFRPS